MVGDAPAQTRDPDSGKRVAVSTIGMQDALSTQAFTVVAPRGLPPGTRLLSIQRVGDPETGVPSRGGTARTVVEASSDTMRRP